MAWDFETDPEFQELLDWADEFVRTEVEPLDLVYPNPYDRSNKEAMAVAGPLKQAVKDKGLWACHLGPELGGQGFGQQPLARVVEHEVDEGACLVGDLVHAGGRMLGHASMVGGGRRPGQVAAMTTIGSVVGCGDPPVGSTVTPTLEPVPRAPASSTVSTCS